MEGTPLLPFSNASTSCITTEKDPSKSSLLLCSNGIRERGGNLKKKCSVAPKRKLK